MAKYTDEQRAAVWERSCELLSRDTTKPPIAEPEPPLSVEQILAEPLEDPLTQWRARQAEREAQLESERVSRWLAETRVKEETTTARAMAELEARIEEKIEKQTVFIFNTVTQALDIIGENSAEAQKILDDTFAKLQQAVNELRKSRGDDKGDVVDLPNPITPRSRLQ